MDGKTYRRRMVNNTHILKENCEVIKKELDWFGQVLAIRLKLHAGQECAYRSVWELAPPDHGENEMYYAKFIRHFQCTPAERMVLMLVLAPHIQPHLLDGFYARNTTYDRGFTEFGGL